MIHNARCFACNKPIDDSRSPLAITSDLAQVVSVGPDCWKRIKAAGNVGYQPSQGGPRLLVLTREREEQFNKEYNRI
jgi:hypothetical protein